MHKKVKNRMKLQFLICNQFLKIHSYEIYSNNYTCNNNFILYYIFLLLHNCATKGMFSVSKQSHWTGKCRILIKQATSIITEYI